MNPARRALALALLLLPACALAGHDPPPLESTVAEYQLLRDDLPLGQVVVSLEILGDGSYVYESRTEPTALLAVFREGEVVERSEGRWSAQGFVPSHYRYVRRDGDEVSEVRVDFDWTVGKATNRAGGTTWKMPVPADAQDKLGQQLSLMGGLSRGLRSLSVPVADGGRLKSYDYEVQGRETLRTAVGELLTLKVLRRKDERPARLTLWCAPSLGYLPVRIDRRVDEELYRMELSAVRHAPTPQSP